MTPREIFLCALRRRPTPRPATGSATSVVTTDLMARVGVSFPEAHLHPEKMARLAAAGYTELGCDNVMPLFSVWHESAALGCAVDWGDSRRMPTGTPCHPSLASPFAVPPRFLQHPACVVPLAALRRLKQHLGNEAAIVGKVFGPWTLGYHIFGVEEFLLSTLTDPDGVKRALRTLLEVTVAFARAQIDAGADALTLADHCTRDLCSPLAYRGFLRELHAELHERLPIPLILHICGDTSDRIGDLRTTGIECFHYDSKVPLPMVRSLAGEQLSLMGGTSNLTVIRSGTAEEITEDVGAKVAAGIDIIGPECAVPLDAPWANLAALTRAAKQRRPPAR